jgi:hypothetical protein
MNITQKEAIRAIDAILEQLNKEIHRQWRKKKFLWWMFPMNQHLHEDVSLALKFRIDDYEALKKFIITRDPRQNTGWAITIWVDANRLRQGKDLVGTHYSILVKKVILPYLAFIFPSE